MKKRHYRIWLWIPTVVMVVLGFKLAFKAAAMTTHLNILVFVAACIIGFGLSWAAYWLDIEMERVGRAPLGLRWIFDGQLFPRFHPIVDDYNELTAKLSNFRMLMADFYAKRGVEENGEMQSHATQMLWHSLFLQKRRMDKLGITLELESERRAFERRDNCVREHQFFDGRYEVNNIYEEIKAFKHFKYQGHTAGDYINNDVARYSVLSAKQVGKNKIICPNCGSSATRENLIDGCDYCGTKFTVEDLENRVGSFSFRRDYLAIGKKAWNKEDKFGDRVVGIILYPIMAFAFIQPIIYARGMNIFIRILLGLLCMIPAYFVALIPLMIIVFITMTLEDKKRFKEIKKYEYSRPDILIKAEDKITKDVQKQDPLFSLQSFFGNLQNKISAVHYAQNTTQINAFSDVDLSEYIKKYQDIVDMDCDHMMLNAYTVDEHLQHAKASTLLYLYRFDGEKVNRSSEYISLELEKDIDCKTQEVCGPSILKCKGCGNNLSLLDGKTCPFCGRELDLKKYDWVITGYKSI